METNLPVFPEIEPYHSGFLPVSDLHSLYYEEVGNPKGKPVVFLHGGPGAGFSPLARRFYDPHFYRIILFDQRGSGQSTPHAELRENSTWDLVGDIERVREMLGIEHWLVFGGSWGSSLSLAYAIQHPERVLGLVLRGIFLCRPSELDWLYKEGASHVFPEGWDQFIAPIPPAERGDLLRAYYQRLTDADLAVQQAAAWPWSRWETQCSRHFPDPAYLEKDDAPLKTLAISRIESPLLCQRQLFPPSGLPAGECGGDQSHPDDHRPGALRHGLPDPLGLGFEESHAGCRFAHHTGRRPFGARTGDRGWIGAGHRRFQAPLLIFTFFNESPRRTRSTQSENYYAWSASARLAYLMDGWQPNLLQA